MSKYGMIGVIDDTLLELSLLVEDMVNCINIALDAETKSEKDEYLIEALEIIKKIEE